MDKFADFRKLSGNTLKIIACVTMFIDHIGAAILLPLIKDGILPVGMSFATIKIIYRALRCIGRTSFPLFIFLIAEGFTHTSNRLRYALSLFVFALISELPFDSAFSGEIDMQHNNVGITLFLALITLWGAKAIYDFFQKNELPATHAIAPALLFILLTSCIAYFLKCDYKYYGIILAVIFCLFKPVFPFNIAAAYLIIASYSTEWLSFPAFILIYMYNQKQGKKLGRYKYLFYAFYPVHLLLLFVIRLLIAKALTQ